MCKSIANLLRFCCMKRTFKIQSLFRNQKSKSKVQLQVQSYINSNEGVFIFVALLMLLIICEKVKYIPLKGSKARACRRWALTMSVSAQGGTYSFYFTTSSNKNFFFVYITEGIICLFRLI